MKKQLSKIPNVTPTELTNLIQFYNIHPEYYIHDQMLPYYYPGSSKGMRPEDDPDTYRKFVMNNCSNSLFRFMNVLN